MATIKVVTEVSFESKELMEHELKEHIGVLNFDQKIELLEKRHLVIEDEDGDTTTYTLED